MSGSLRRHYAFGVLGIESGKCVCRTVNRGENKNILTIPFPYVYTRAINALKYAVRSKNELEESGTSGFKLKL